MQFHRTKSCFEYVEFLNLSNLNHASNSPNTSVNKPISLSISIPSSIPNMQIQKIFMGGIVGRLTAGHCVQDYLEKGRKRARGEKVEWGPSLPVKIDHSDIGGARLLLTSPDQVSQSIKNNAYNHHEDRSITSVLEHRIVEGKAQLQADFSGVQMEEVFTNSTMGFVESGALINIGKGLYFSGAQEQPNASYCGDKSATYSGVSMKRAQKVPKILFGASLFETRYFRSSEYFPVC